MVYLSPEKRARIFTLFEEGYPSRYIASKENVSQSTVIRIKQRKDTNGTFKNQPKSGHPRYLTGQNNKMFCILFHQKNVQMQLQFKKS